MLKPLNNKVLLKIETSDSNERSGIILLSKRDSTEIGQVLSSASSDVSVGERVMITAGRGQDVDGGRLVDVKEILAVVG